MIPATGSSSLSKQGGPEMRHHRRSERALRRDLDRLARSRVEAPAAPDRVIVPFSLDAQVPEPTSVPAIPPLEHGSDRVGAGVHIVERLHKDGDPRG